MLFKGICVFANHMPRAIGNQLEYEMDNFGLCVDSKMPCRHSHIHTHTHATLACKKEFLGKQTVTHFASADKMLLLELWAGL